uniref:Variant surface glycoprotein 1125.1406 n=1 Tax=Trypanosoma brucei TaxID=5691 RepID=A0A1J0R4K7_9TRYP|nr:variant surface glycoprotein 1125.1406 [Trypanosoma brucei]
MSENLRPLTALLLAVAAVEAAAAATKALDQSAWIGYCRLSEDISKIEANGRARLADINSLRKNSETALRLQLFALLTPSEMERTKAAALALWLQEKSETAADAGLKAKAGQAIEAAAANYYAKGRVDELLELMLQTKGAPHGCLQTGDGNNGNPATKSQNKIAIVECSLDRKQTQSGYSKPGILTASGLGTEPIPTAKGATKQTNTKNCNLLKVNANGFGAEEQQTATSVSYGGGLFEAAKTDAERTGAPMASLKTSSKPKHKIRKDAFITMDSLDKLDTSQHDNQTDDNTPAAELEHTVTAILSEPKNRGQQTPQTSTLRLFAKPISKTIQQFIENVEKHPLKKGNLGVTEDINSAISLECQH